MACVGIRRLEVPEQGLPAESCSHGGPRALQWCGAPPGARPQLRLRPAAADPVLPPPCAAAQPLSDGRGRSFWAADAHEQMLGGCRRLTGESHASLLSVNPWPVSQ